MEDIMTINKVKELVATQLNKPVESIADEAKLIEDLGADSLDVVEMLMTLEDEFGITIPDEETSKLTTIKEIADMIDSKKA
ncbi:MAG: acyl carrier protein [Clostridia bacterium]|nr:acyl carrier protein [Clostridia bacterium]